MEAERAAASAKKAASLTQAAPTTQAHDQRGAVVIAGTADDEYSATRARGVESAARERSNGRPAPCTMPHCGVKTTRGGDSHFDPLATHTGTSAYPQARQRFAAPTPGARWRTGDRCRGGSDPNCKRLVMRAERAVG